MFLSERKAGLLVSLVVLGGMAFGPAVKAVGQVETERKIRNKVEPSYPDLARRMKIAGVVKVEITVEPNGSVKEAKVVGGHPVLANAVLDAVKKWRFEPGPQETIEKRQFRFDPDQ